jgi:hypothetical protein
MLLLPALAEGTNLNANVTLPNPSVMTLEVVCTLLNFHSPGSIILTMFRAPLSLTSKAAIS